MGANVATGCYIEQVLMMSVVAGVVIVGWLLVAGSIADGPVAAGRVATFAQRHALIVTPTNGNQLIRYLATTRRWRVAGLSAGFIASVAWALPQQRVYVNFLALFAGWFAGALVAEARLAHLERGPRRAASLVPRRVDAYRSRAVSLLLPASMGLSVAVAAASLVVGARPDALLWFATALAVLCGVSLVQRRVLHRPQPLAPPDRLAADDAIRSRSLQVLAAAGATLVLYCVLGQLGALRPALSGVPGQLAEAAAFLGVFVAPVIGLLAASARPRGPVRAT
jgi:hypothetical protein